MYIILEYYNINRKNHTIGHFLSAESQVFAIFTAFLDRVEQRQVNFILTEKLIKCWNTLPLRH